ncbi:ATP-dependent nuclease [Sediminicola luteus]|uniref:AAA family ATPase n=1 Tax=Sediminicola luteus TaxID=319238 RepID=A0A2A4G409_9FLAO|nr:AAA family ATPase [Sediminicola luteus]PCE63171.1 AAA family ATPase [Sediminicola luteus]
MTPRVWINNINFNDGSKIEIEKDEILVFVGPNNVGKSVTLADLSNKILRKSHNAKTILSIELSKNVNVDELIDYLYKSSTISDADKNKQLIRSYKLNQHEMTLRHQWNNSEEGLESFAGYFSNYLTTIDRLKSVNPPQSISLANQPPSHPIHILERDDKIELKFSNFFNRAFGTDLVVHRNAGNLVPMHIGKRPEPDEGEDRISLNYVKKVENLPKLHEQGDGMKSFVGVLLNSFISQYTIVLIDEPEAFLHPPQARLLGKMIGKDLPTDRQLFLATHSGDFLRGLLDSESKKIRVVRIDRNGNNNKFCELSPDKINQIWSDPILRHSNILDGIFHKRVVICESDSDCRFYSAIIESLVEKQELSSPDIMFVNCGGKHRIPQIVMALKRLNVDVSVISDFDVINNIHPLRKIVENLGGNWDSFNSKWLSVKKAIDEKGPELKTTEVKSQISFILDNTTDRVFPKRNATAIKDVLKKSSSWSHAKHIGSSFIPPGEATTFFNQIQQNFKSIGLYIVEVGELEGFCRSEGGHGPKWVNEVLKKDLATDPELEKAREFVLQIIS